METGQDQFLFARINVDIADSKNARDVGFEAGSVHNDLFSFERQAPIRNRSEFRLQAEEKPAECSAGMRRVTPSAPVTLTSVIWPFSSVKPVT